MTKNIALEKEKALQEQALQEEADLLYCLESYVKHHPIKSNYFLSDKLRNLYNKSTPEAKRAFRAEIATSHPRQNTLFKFERYKQEHRALGGIANAFSKLAWIAIEAQLAWNIVKNFFGSIMDREIRISNPPKKHISNSNRNITNLTQTPPRDVYQGTHSKYALYDDEGFVYLSTGDGSPQTKPYLPSPKSGVIVPNQKIGRNR